MMEGKGLVGYAGWLSSGCFVPRWEFILLELDS